MHPPIPTDSILGTIGNTPVIKLQRVVPSNYANVFVKLEAFNPTGSYKDRMALAMIEEAEKRGTLKPGMTVVECTGGSTGSSLAMVCAAKGYRFHVVSSDAFAVEKLKTMQAFGADLEIVRSPTGMITADLIPKMLAVAEEIGSGDDCYLTDQFNNQDSQVGFAEMGEELLLQFPNGFDAFCGAVGTAGMLMGVAGVFRRNLPAARIVALEPALSPVISEGRTGEHHVEGIGVGFIPPLLNENLYDEVRGVSESEARDMCRLLAENEGLLVGVSSGLNIVGALDLARELGPGKKVVTVACDTGLKYLGGDLFGTR
ncbi:MAG: cysteine synthase family protein [Microbacteriaceae bacterium]|nr:cysteine synthase family protein [Microbacteriaceae bacterium]